MHGGGPIECSYCHTRYKPSVLENVPYELVGLVLLLSLFAFVAFVARSSSEFLFILVWVVFGFVWYAFIPLQPIKQ